MPERKLPVLVLVLATLPIGPSAFGQAPITFSLSDGGANGLAFTPDGKHLAALVRVPRLNQWSTITFWDVKTGKQNRIATLVVPYRAPAFVIQPPFTDLAFTPNGKELHTVTTVGYYVWDTKKYQEQKRQRIPGIESLAISGDGKKIALGLDTGIISAHGVRVAGHTGQVWALAWSPDGNTLASAATDGNAMLWGDKGMRKAGPWRHKGNLYTIRFSPDGKFVATGSDEGVKVWDARTGAHVAVVPSDGKQTRAVAFAPNGKTLVCAMDNEIVFVKVGAWKPAERLRGHRTYVKCLLFSPDGKVLASGDQNGIVKLWDREQGK